MHWEVGQQDSGKKLIAFLKEKLGDDFSARHIKRLIEENQCQVNGKVERFASFHLGAGDKVTLKLEERKKEISIDRALYEDEDLYIYNKPAGVTSESLKPQPNLELVHRLDKDTTGVLIFAKNIKTRDAMFQLFRDHKIKKTYLAVVNDIPAKKKGVVENYLGKIHEYQGQSLWGEVDKSKGLYAYTEWQCEIVGNGFALIKCFPKTGRTHQIRVHLSSIGHPILGDYQYGRNVNFNYQPNRCLLHALSVEFIHPTTNSLVTVTAPLPDDFQDYAKF